VISRDAFAAATALLLPKGLGDVLKERHMYAEANKQALYDIFTKVVDATPGGSRFAAFAIADPYKLAPPTMTDRLVRRTSLTDFALRTYGPDQQNHRIPNIMGRRYVERHMRSFEDEQVLRREIDSGSTALRGLQQYSDMVLAENWRPEGVAVVEQFPNGERGEITEIYSDQSVHRYDTFQVAFNDIDNSQLPRRTTSRLINFREIPIWRRSREA